MPSTYRYRRSAAHWTRRPHIPGAILANGTPAYEHCTGPDDHSPTVVREYDSRCGWCYLGAPHTLAAHVDQIADRILR